MSVTIPSLYLRNERERSGHRKERGSPGVIVASVKKEMRCSKCHNFLAMSYYVVTVTSTSAMSFYMAKVAHTYHYIVDIVQLLSEVS